MVGNLINWDKSRQKQRLRISSVWLVVVELKERVWWLLSKGGLIGLCVWVSRGFGSVGVQWRSGKWCKELRWG
jgi:hypothetical protein